MKGYLITLEGIDGCGKSAISEHLQQRLKDYDIVYTTEPTRSWIGDVVKRAICSDTNPLAEAFLFVADHAEHVNKIIKPAMENGKIVISDRYLDSRYAYQGVTLSDVIQDPIKWLRQIHKDWTIVPNMTLLFVVNPEVALSRCKNRFDEGESNEFERIEFLGQVQSNYLRLVEGERDRFVIIDAEKELKEVEKEAEDKILSFISK
jgi:dTMP kinase